MRGAVDLRRVALLARAPHQKGQQTISNFFWARDWNERSCFLKKKMSYATRLPTSPTPL